MKLKTEVGKEGFWTLWLYFARQTAKKHFLQNETRHDRMECGFDTWILNKFWRFLSPTWSSLDLLTLKSCKTSFPLESLTLTRHWWILLIGWLLQSLYAVFQSNWQVSLKILVASLYLFLLSNNPLCQFGFSTKMVTCF